jgi:protein TonB
MMPTMQLGLRKERIAAAAAAVLLEGALLYALMAGLFLAPRSQDRDARLTVLEISPPAESDPPPPPPEASPPKDLEKASPWDDISPRAAPVTAPPPTVTLPPVQPIIAAPTSAIGDASEVSQGEASATGDRSAPARHVAGALSRVDFPRWASGRVGGTVALRYSVETNGRVGSCDITKSSGSARLDNYTCELVRKRYRFEPMRDATGQAVRTYIPASYIWVPWKPNAAD